MTELTHPLATVPQDELVARAEADPLRPRFHFVSPAGWLNDPNGVSHWDGTYHLFYQYNPEGAFHHRIHWGHATSADLVTWTDQAVALEPSAGPDAEGCWSGVLVNDGGTPTLVYSGRLNERELPCVAVGSPDLLTWTKAPENPVISAPPAGVDITAYRDHCVWREGEVWRQLVGSGIRGRGGTAFLYESTDLRSWNYIGPLFIGDASEGDPTSSDWTGTMWECVDLFRAGAGALGSTPAEDAPDVLVFSAWNDGDTHHPLYWTGRYSGDTFEPKALHRLDYGGRYFYAPQSFMDASGRRVMFGWLQEGRSDAAMVAAGWSGVMSLPRVVTLGRDGTLEAAPVPELARLRQDHVNVPGRMLVGPGAPEDTGIDGTQLDLELELNLAPGSALQLGVLGSDGDEEATVIEVSRPMEPSLSEGRLRLDRTRSSLAAGGSGDDALDVDEKSGPVPMTDGHVRLRVLVDRSAVEIFANGKPLTARVYPTLGGGHVSLAAAAGTVRLLSLDAWTMKDIFEDARPLFP
ncbi:glycoside hydrolase family 32 protein [Paenarthrobacter ureafaciens]|jgi:beta-fructofuranosidase|uniref:glycoside hydrolase family 32 protein n=1 Tax=Paenarthrobacter ureafaciens TaxID=37931 RepID=UPI00140E44B1|nr:glycoside hydrolase family 32 protein [Paenarthrobacter ureafaciens]MCX8455441.1 glycoside hydrolase family 32 protein [Paenarthrobacter ureafaciens]MCY0973686.1 glycoside hydrolase family 32 protein [Paenarthrobacter ureafaciens]QQQ62736.1 glycoside hydrolase family 32 protein [Paenarthrobacter ureafaciens]